MKVQDSPFLDLNQESILAYEPGTSLAMVDVETYPAFIDAKADQLDLMAHFSNQMQALTVLSWKAPEKARRFRLVVTEDDRQVERIGRSNPAQIASGNLRTYGQVLLATHEHFFNCARNRDGDLLQADSLAKIDQPQLLNLPPGVYAIALYYHAPFRQLIVDSGAAGQGAQIDYTLIMRHYAFPPARVAPVRLSAGFIPYAGEETASEAWGRVTSHKAPGVGLSKLPS